ncbi:MAG: ABC transporter substrate-binding protein [Tetragenococcus halophilus]|nr:ABC transporter substrate-binding protein [Tetragenococcus halophilus]
MKNNKNKSLILTIIALVVLVVGIGASQMADQDQLLAENQQGPDRNDDHFYIGLLQYTAHPSLDSISQGIIDMLAENGYVDGESITLDFQNGQGDQSNLNTMSTRFVSNDADLMIAVATPAAMAVANASSDIPVLLGAVTDPENVDLVDSNEEPGGNVTGISDMSPIDQQLDLIRQIQPEAETIGLLYSSSEDNSILQANMAEKMATEYGFETVKRTVSSTNDVAQVTQQLVTEVDAIWTPNDNVVASAFPNVLEVSNEAQIPVYPAVDMMVAQGGLATLGLNQYQIGVKAGEMAVELLEGDIEPATAPVRFAEETDLVINYETAELLNITIPESLAEDAIDSKELQGESE